MYLAHFSLQQAMLALMLRDLAARQAVPSQVALLLGGSLEPVAVANRQAASAAKRWRAVLLLLTALLSGFYLSAAPVTVPAHSSSVQAGITAAESSPEMLVETAPARLPEPHSGVMSLSQPAMPALANQLQQLLQWQQETNWAALLSAVTPALRQQYPQQVLALEAYAASQLGDHQRALQACQQWAQRYPTDGRAWLGQAIALEQLVQPKQARFFYQRALDLGGISVASQQYIRQRLATGGE